MILSLDGALQFQILALQLLEPLTLVGPDTRALTRVALCLSHPAANDSAVQLIFAAIDSIAAHCES